MLLINYLHKIQGIDKSLPILIVLRKHLPDLRIVSIIDLEDTAVNRIPPDLLEMLKNVSDQCFEMNSGPARSTFPGIFGRLQYKLKDQSLHKKHIIQLEKEGIYLDREPVTLLCINSCENMWLGKSLVRTISSVNGKIVAYLKSVHDRNRGLTVDKENNVSKKKNFYDTLLVPNKEMNDLLISAGYLESEIFVSGYTPFYRDWLEAIRTSDRVGKLRKGKNPKIVVFSRGPVEQKKGGAQVLTAEIEQQLLNDIVTVVNKQYPEAEIWFKPHPYQRITPIRKICEEHENCSIKWDSIHTLCSASDIAISMYSSSSLDALVFNKPSIEYFIESPGFRQAHPKGSPFGKYGVKICRTKDELAKILESVVPGHPEESNVIEAFGHSEPIDRMLRLLS